MAQTMLTTHSTMAALVMRLMVADLSIYRHLHIRPSRQDTETGLRG